MDENSAQTIVRVDFSWTESEVKVTKYAVAFLLGTFAPKLEVAEERTIPRADFDLKREIDWCFAHGWAVAHGTNRATALRGKLTRATESTRETAPLTRTLSDGRRVIAGSGARRAPIQASSLGGMNND